MKIQSVGWWSLLACVLAATGSGTAYAQVPAGTLNRYSAAETPDDDFNLSRATGFGHLQLGAQLHVDYAANPLVWETTPGDADSETRIVDHQLNGTLGVSFGLWDRLVVFGGLPVVLWMDGASDREASMSGLPGADDSGLGNAYVGSRVRLVGDENDFWALAFQATLSVPTSDLSGDPHFRGSDGVGFRPELLAELRPGLGSRVVFNAGTLLQEQESGLSNFERRNELSFGLGFAMPVWTQPGQKRTHVDVAAQVYGATAFGRFFDREHTPLEGTVGGRFFHANGLRLGAAAGTGFSRGIGTPDARVIVTLGYALPLVARSEGRSSVYPTTGQPREVSGPCGNGACKSEPVDTDGDGTPDDVDACPGEAEDVDGFEDADGCPDTDNDADGVADAADACVGEPGPPENDGCPDSDTDGDGVVDRLDNCPKQAGSPDHAGCDEPQKVALSAERIEIDERIRFATGSAKILPESHAVLENIAGVLREHPEIIKVRVEGHSDSRGSAASNLDLSQRRAEAVVAFLAEEGGLSAERLEAKGYGAQRPLQANASTDEEHAKNRRVELQIVDTASHGPEGQQ